jgi:mannitol/fructose-specific phosphotransferase system IIA component (Ntr-type)
VLAEAKEVKDQQVLLNSVLEREATRTTGIGNGLAIPHGKCNGVDHLVVAIGKPAAPIDFESIDGRPVNLIVLLASPPDQTGPHIQALARISRLMNVDAFRQAMRAATTSQQIYDAVVAQEASM